MREFKFINLILTDVPRKTGKYTKDRKREASPAKRRHTVLRIAKNSGAKKN